MTRSTCGLTVVEVLIATVVLSLTTAALVGMLTTADRLRGRSMSMTHAVLLAMNETERIRKDALYYGVPGDTVYELQQGPIRYEVSRQWVEAPRGELGEIERVREMELVVVDKSRNRRHVFRLVQGYLQ